MSKHSQSINDLDEASDEGQRVQRFIYRLFPFFPLIILGLALGVLGAYINLRYKVSIYQVNAKIIVNDDSQQKNANLQEIFQLDTRNLSVEAEREMEILRSSDLLGKLVSSLDLNVQYTQKGYVKSGEYYDNIPFKLDLESPDSIKQKISGEIELVNNQLKFKGVFYPVDTFVDSKFGRIKWHINRAYLPTPESDKWQITILPVSSTVNILQSSLTIQPISKQSSILALSYVDAIPARGIDILANLIHLYGTTTVDYKSRISANTLSFLDERLRLVSEELNGVEKNLQSYKSSAGIVDLGAEGTLLLDQLKETDSKIGELDVKVDVIKQIEQYVAKRNNSNSPVPATLGIDDPVLISLLNQLYQAEFELEKTKQISGSKNPQIEVYEDAISKLKPSIVASINNLKIGMLASRQRLQGDNSRIVGTLGKIPQKERLLLDISRQQGIKNAIYTFLLQKREESAINAAVILPNYRLIEKPESGGRISPVPGKIYGNAILISLILIAIIIYLFEFANNRLLFREQIENALPNVPIIGELIFQRTENESPIVVGEGKRTLVAEQFRELRTNLNYITSTTKENCKIILVTSSIPGEGKSFVAINTAISLTLTGAKVVLLEFDLRKPKISKPLGISRDPGLSNYLINKADESQIIKSHPTIANFSIIPSGPIPPNPAELIGGNRLLELFDYLKLHFDYVLIDSPPIAAVTDAKILAAIAHATVYITRYNYTNRSFLKLIKDNYQKRTLPNINLVFNGITTKKILGYSYGEGYGYGYGNAEGYGYTEKRETKSWWRKLFKSTK
ncbi:MAG: polysaccharide biosynthesis tyrosine autokinase [Ferruginibacter sp.]